MSRVAPWAAALILIAAGVVIGLQGRSAEKDSAQPGLSADEEKRCRELLADRGQAWWKGHRLPMPASVQIVYKPADQMGSFDQPPVACPVMPVEVARGLLKGISLPADHPLANRPVRLVDMRLRSRHLVEHIPGSVSVPFNRMQEGLKSGALAGLDRRTIVLLYGDVYPHYDATAPFRVENFEAYYALEGGLKAWKARGYPVESNTAVAEYLKSLESERVVGNDPPSSDPADIGPAALKALLDQGLQPLIVFVGDEATYRVGHLPGAIRVTQGQVKERFEKEPRDRMIVVYCGCCEGSAKGLSGIAVESLRAMGFTRLFHLFGHLKGWKDQGYPLERSEN